MGWSILSQIFGPDRYLADTLSGGVKYSIGDGRRNRRSGHFAHAFGRIGVTFDDIDFDLRAFVQAQHRVIVEVALLHAPVFDGDFAVQQGA